MKRKNEITDKAIKYSVKNPMEITVEYKTPEKGSVERKELDADTEIKFILDWEVLDE